MNRAWLVLPVFALIMGACGSTTSQESKPAAGTGPADESSESDAGSADDERHDAGRPRSATADAATEAGAAPDAPEPGMRSTLYPKGWTPGTCDAAGRCLQDYSYAGYKLGATLPTAPYPGVTASVVSAGADATGQTDSTAAFQAAIAQVSSSAQGGTVFVPQGLYRIDGLLQVSASHVHLRGEGPGKSRVYFTQAPATGAKHLTFGTEGSLGPAIALTSDTAPFQSTVQVGNAAGLQVGDDVVIGAVITDAFIAEHGMTGVWQAFNGTFQAFFRRSITAIDTSKAPQTITLDVPLRYALKVRDQVAIKKETGLIANVSVDDLGVSNAVSWSEAWGRDRVHVLGFRGVKDAWVRNVESFSSPRATGQAAGLHLQNGGIYVGHSKRVTIAQTVMAKAENRGENGSGYLFEISQSSEVLTVDSTATAGRHNFIQNWGFGTSGCVWLRCASAGGLNMTHNIKIPGVGIPAYSEFHHSLAMANLIDSCTLDDGFQAVDRGSESTGAGATSTENVFWNNRGKGILRSKQYGRGYVIGTAQGLSLDTADNKSSPTDFTEFLGSGDTLFPGSLYEHQRAARMP